MFTTLESNSMYYPISVSNKSNQGLTNEGSSTRNICSLSRNNNWFSPST